MSGTAVYTWSNFGKVVVGEEIAGAGTEDPFADIAVSVTGIIRWRNAPYRFGDGVSTRCSSNDSHGSKFYGGLHSQQSYFRRGHVDLPYPRQTSH